MTQQTGSVVIQGEFGIGITLTTEQIEVFAIDLIENLINVIDEILIHIITIGILIKNAVTPQQLNA